MRRWVTKEGPGLARTPALAFVWVRGNVSLLCSGHGPWRRLWGPGGLRICPVHVPGGAAGGADRERRDTHTHTPDPPGPRSRQTVVAGWEGEAGPSGSVSEGTSDEPGRGRAAVQPHPPLWVLPSPLHLKPREGKELGLRRGAQWGSRGLR